MKPNRIRKCRLSGAVRWKLRRRPHQRNLRFLSLPATALNFLWLISSLSQQMGCNRAICLLPTPATRKSNFFRDFWALPVWKFHANSKTSQRLDPSGPRQFGIATKFFWQFRCGRSRSESCRRAELLAKRRRFGSAGIEKTSLLSPKRRKSLSCN